MIEIFRQAERLQQELAALRPLNRETEQRIMQKFRLDWNFHSNSLEGNALTYGETKALILFGITANGKPLKDHFEITGHNEAVKWIEEVVKEDRPLTESFIRQLHQLILPEPFHTPAQTFDGQATRKLVTPGKYKTLPNHVQTVTGEMFYFATPEETPAKMDELITWFRQEKEDAAHNPILLAAQFHYRFIRIHPFDDGNGRTARMLMNFILMQYGYPPVIIRTDDKANYIAALRQADAGLLEPFSVYIAQNLVHSLELMLKGARGESIEEPEDLDRRLALLAGQLKEVGQEINVVKSKEVLLELFDESLDALIEKILEMSEKFRQFYIKGDFWIFFDTIRAIARDISDRKKWLLASRMQLYSSSNVPSSMNLKAEFAELKYKGFTGTNFSFEMRVGFNLTSYTISLDQKTLQEKLYSESLTEEEIAEVVQYVADLHETFLGNLIVLRREKGSHKFNTEMLT